MVSEEIKFLNRSKNYPGVPPLLDFQNCQAAFLGSKTAYDDETLHADLRGRGRKSVIGFKRIQDGKIFTTLLYGMFI